MEYVIYTIKKFSKKFSKEAARSSRIKPPALETKLKILDSKMHFIDDAEYIHCKEEFNKLYQTKFMIL